ncbi:hypothetical protein [Rhizobium sp. 2MFCol3.1]|uniref:hypothetical protein n=1 Tax=Rhizobium sp. 2MFCol3.1 TaxID=1246459 RepID=UPI00037F73E0|nr:hypothetical protein [Rhizobium sp. 2MFCol3.1]
MLKLIEGGLSQSKTQAAGEKEQIQAEGQRRMRQAGVDRFLAREKLTGIAMPSTIRVFMLQVEFAVEALSRLSPIPSNIMDDGYWPTCNRAAPFEAALIRR